MKIAICGASGFVGRHLVAHLLWHGYAVISIFRADFDDPTDARLIERISDCDAVINLSGAPILHRWSHTYRKKIVSSRVNVTRRLAAAIDRSPRTCTFISTSAIGYYPSVGCYDEFSAQRGSGFLSDLCESWEQAAHCATARTVITRFGVVLGLDGGALKPMLWPLRCGFLVIFGRGLHPFSWISIEDLVRAQEFLLTNTNLDGLFNITSPESTTFNHFFDSLSAHFHPHFTIKLPPFMLRLRLGQASQMLLDGQCVEPTRLLRAGFCFSYPTLDHYTKSLTLTKI